MRSIDNQDTGQTEPPGTPYTQTSPSSPAAPDTSEPTNPTNPSTPAPGPTTTTNPTVAGSSEPSLIDQILALGEATGGSVPTDGEIAPASTGINWILVLLVLAIGGVGFYLFKKYGKESHHE